MKNIVFLLVLPFLFSCSGNRLPVQHSETKGNLEFTFRARHYHEKTRVNIDVELKNSGIDTLYFFIFSCNEWYGVPDIEDRFSSDKYAIKCFPEGPIIGKIAPAKSVKHTFHYASSDNKALDEIRFGITCDPIEKDFDLSPTHVKAYLKNRKMLMFKKTSVRISD